MYDSQKKSVKPLLLLYPWVKKQKQDTGFSSITLAIVTVYYTITAESDGEIILKMLTDFQNTFTVRFSTDCVINWSLTFSYPLSRGRGHSENCVPILCPIVGDIYKYALHCNPMAYWRGQYWETDCYHFPVNFNGLEPPARKILLDRKRLKIPSHLKCVAALSSACKTSVFKNWSN